MSDNLYTKTCDRCGKVFRTDKKRKRTCPTCQRKPYYQKPQNKAERKKPKVSLGNISLRKMTAIIEQYNQTHGTSYTYGKFIYLVQCGKIKIEGGLD